MNKSKIEVINEIKTFLEGKNPTKYLVNVEVEPDTNKAKCTFHEPGKNKEIKYLIYKPFIYIKDFKAAKRTLYGGDAQTLKREMSNHGITIEKLKHGNQERLKNGYCYMVSSSISSNAITTFFRNGGVDPYKATMSRNKDTGKMEFDIDERGRKTFENRSLFYIPRLADQFFISTGIRLFKGMEDYATDLHKLIFDIETTGLRYRRARIFSIGVKDNRGFETTLDVEKDDDDESEREVIRKLFSLIYMLKPAVVMGFNSEKFDFDFIEGRMEMLGMSKFDFPTSLDPDKPWTRIPNSSVKFGGETERYTATRMFGTSILDIYHAARKTAAINSDMKNTKLKYICKFEGIAKPNRTYVDGEDGGIGKLWLQNKMYAINPNNNNYIIIPNKYQQYAERLYNNLSNKNTNIELYNTTRLLVARECPDFVVWFRNNAVDAGMTELVKGKTILRQYLLDDLWETEQVDNLYNQSTFLLAKIVPTIFSRVATMGNAAIWNLLMTAWSYENGLAIPYPDKLEKFSGGLVRCYKKGYAKNINKIDFASLYPMIQLSEDVFPIFDITGVLRMMLTYMTSTRNIYKKLAANDDDDMKQDEIELLEHLDNVIYHKFKDKTITDEERAKFKVKQLPIKIINNSLFGSLGSGIAFNWSDNRCAARITCTGRLHLRNAITYFKNYGCQPLLAVTDGVNFSIPLTTRIIVNEKEPVYRVEDEISVDIAWKYGGKTGIDALIKKFNTEEMKPPFMSVDNDGKFVSCLNLSRINYALLVEKKNKKTGEIEHKIKLTGNTIKSKIMPEYIEEFIDNGMKYVLGGKGWEFVRYYQSYANKIFNKEIPLKKLATKKKIKNSISDYLNRGNNKKGKPKAKQAHMELLILDRDRTAERLFAENYSDIVSDGRPLASFSLEEKHKLIEDYMPPQPELDSVVYYINIANKGSVGDSKTFIDKNNVEKFASVLLNSKDLEENPDKIGEYNIEKYLTAFNKRVKVLLEGFNPEIRNEILSLIDRKPVKVGRKIVDYTYELFCKNDFLEEDLELQSFDHDNYQESMYLEDKEIEFWNRYGYDPRKIWDGFKTNDDNKIFYETYESALHHIRTHTKYTQIKSVNDDLTNGDHVLFKDNDIYSIGYNNGSYIEIIEDNVDVRVKTEEEIAQENERNARNAIIKKLNLPETDEEMIVFTEAYNDFLISINITNPTFSMIDYFSYDPKCRPMFEDFYEEWKYDNGYEFNSEEYTYDDYDD